GRAAQQDGLAPAAARTKLHLDALAHRPPLLRRGQLRTPLRQLGARGPNEIPAARRLKPGEILAAGHAAIHHPDPLRLPVALLHRLDDLLDRRHVGAVPREDLVAEREAAAGDHQGDVDLLAVGAMIATVAALR